MKSERSSGGWEEFLKGETMEGGYKYVSIDNKIDEVSLLSYRVFPYICVTLICIQRRRQTGDMNSLRILKYRIEP